MENELLKAEDVAQMLQVSKHYIYQLKAERKIPFIKIGGCVRFRRSDVESWINANLVC